MRPERIFSVGSHPCQGYRKTSYNGWAWGLLSTGSLKFREWEPDEANGEIQAHGKGNYCYVCTNRVMAHGVTTLRAGHAGRDGLAVDPTDASLLFHRLEAGGELLDDLH